MKTIYKYSLEPLTKQFVSLPQKAKMLSVTEQKGKIVLYALVDTDEIPWPRKISIYGTGQFVDDETLHFLGTVKLQGGEFMLHVFTD